MEEPDPKPESDSVSLKSEHSMGHPISFREESPTEQPGKMEQSDPAPGPKCVSMKSDHSMSCNIDFSNEQPSVITEEELGLEDLSGQKPDKQLRDVFKQLEETIIAFVREELAKFNKAIYEPQPSSSEAREKERSREAFLEITLDFLRGMKQDKLAQHLESSFYCGVSQLKLQSLLKQKYLKVSEGVTKVGGATTLNDIYTDLYITEGGTAGVSDEHEFGRIETTSRKSTPNPQTTIACEDIFKGCVRGGDKIPQSVARHAWVRTVLTMGVAGIGKTVLTQKFSLDWAEGRANQDMHLLFPFTFRELNVLRDKQLSLVGLVQHFFSKSIKLCSSKIVHTVFIFDGLDECRFSLDFTKTVTDPSEPSSVGALMVNLIKGSLLPYARIWITTRPAAASQIPAECICMVTEVRGFTDSQKEQYFRKRFREEQVATAVISHIKKSRSLHTMCQIPVFCWITSTVLEDVMKTGDMELPHTLTNMYLHLLMVQAKLKNVKYDKLSETDPVWTSSNRTMVLSLAKLAYEQLKKGNLIFYESDLVECGLDVEYASLYSGVFTQVFKEESGLYLEKVYCFVHLSVQEFLAALHVLVTFVNTGDNLLKKKHLSSIKKWLRQSKKDLHQLHQAAIVMAMQSPNGQWDLFLRFLLGLTAMSKNNPLLNLKDKDIHSGVPFETVEYIHEILKRNISAEKTINLFHCLNELGDHTHVKAVQKFMSDGHFSRRASPLVLSGLVFSLLSSDNDLSVFDLNKFCASEEALLRLLPVVKEAHTAILACCNLSFESCCSLSSVLSSSPSHLRILDISNNDLYDRGVEQLCQGLKSDECRLETLRLSGCLVSEKGGAALVSALSSPFSHLKELDLSYNHPGATTTEKLTALQEDPSSPLNTLRVEPGGQEWLTPGLRKYLCDLTLDPNSTHRRLKLSEDNCTVTMTESDLPYSDHPDRFDSCQQVLCSTGLTGRCYWEVFLKRNWSGWELDVAVSYRGIGRKGGSGESGFGHNDKSWCLRISTGGYSILHEGKQIPVSSSYSSSDRVAVYLDYAAGSLSFYKIRGDELVHLHTFTSTFTEPLYAGFGFGLWSSGVSVSFRCFKSSFINRSVGEIDWGLDFQ